MKYILLLLIPLFISCEEPDNNGSWGDADTSKYRHIYPHTYIGYYPYMYYRPMPMFYSSHVIETELSHPAFCRPGSVRGGFGSRGSFGGRAGG